MITLFWTRVLIVNLICWGFFIPYFYLRVKIKLQNFTTYWYIVTSYFLLASFVLYRSLPLVFSAPELHFPPTAFALGLVVVLYGIFCLLNRYRHTLAAEEDVMEYLEKFPGNAAPSLHLRYFAVISSHVLFQQFLVAASVITWRDLIGNPLYVSLLFAFFFGLGHLALYYFIVLKKRTMPLSIGLLFSVASFCGGFLFSYLILEVPSGYIYAFLLHMTYYATLGVFLRRQIGSRSKNNKISFG